MTLLDPFVRERIRGIIRMLLNTTGAGATSQLLAVEDPLALESCPFPFLASESEWSQRLPSQTPLELTVPALGLEVRR